jgi:hypothetical protein
VAAHTCARNTSHASLASVWVQQPPSFLPLFGSNNPLASCRQAC